MRHSPTLKGVIALTTTTLLLAGCGKSQPKSNEPPPFRGIYTTSGDCADSGKFSVDQCLEAMEKAVVQHEKTAPSYKSLKTCEATEGEGRCERTHSDAYRPVLLAFLMTASKPPVATPLYTNAGAKAKAAGFRTTGKDQFTIGDETVAMSRHAQSLAESAFGKKKARRSVF